MVPSMEMAIRPGPVAGAYGGRSVSSSVLRFPSQSVTADAFHAYLEYCPAREMRDGGKSKGGRKDSQGDQAHLRKAW